MLLSIFEGRIDVDTCLAGETTCVAGDETLLKGRGDPIGNANKPCCDTSGAVLCDLIGGGVIA